MLECATSAREMTKRRWSGVSHAIKSDTARTASLTGACTCGYVSMLISVNGSANHLLLSYVFQLYKPFG